MDLADLLHLLAGQSLILSVKDCRGLFIILTLFPFADDTFFLDHSLESLDRFLQRLILVDLYKCH